MAVRRKVLIFGEVLGQPQMEEFLKWCDKHPSGFIANVKIPNGQIVIHGADCPWGRGESWGDPTNTNIKLTCLDQDDLIRSVQRRWPEAPWFWCGHCFWDE